MFAWSGLFFNGISYDPTIIGQRLSATPVKV